MGRPVLAAALVLASCLLQARAVRAQQRSLSPRPFQGLFGAAEPGGSRTESLDLSASLFGGYDGNVVADNGLSGFGAPLLLPPGSVSLPAGPPGLLPSAPSTGAGLSSGLYGASTALSYVHRWRHSSLNAYGSASLSQYPSVSDAPRAAYAGGIGFSTPVGRRNRLHVTQSIARVPYYSLAQIFPDLPALDDLDVPIETPTFDLGLVPAAAYRMFSNANLTRDLSRRSSLSFYFTRHGTIFSGSSSSSYFDTSDARAGVRFVREITRNTSLHLGYAYRMGRYDYLDTRSPYTSHEIDAGVDYARSFTFWRRTTFAFTTGSSILADQPLGTDVVGNHTRVFVNGTATLVREFLRSWSARAQYTRGVNYLDGFAAPILADSATFGVGGLLTRRITANAGGSASFGHVGLRRGREDNAYTTWTMFSAMNIALTRHLATFVNYFYYRYDIQSGVVLPTGIPAGYHRNGLRAGLKVWVPII